MKILVIGTGLQGRAALFDLATEGGFDLVAADLDIAPLRAFLNRAGLEDRVRCETVDVLDRGSVDRLFSERFEAVVDLLPVALHDPVAEASVRHAAHYVHGSYASQRLKTLSAEAGSKGIALLPEMGLDPGIDLIFLGDAVRRFDAVEAVASYGAGFPEASCARPPLCYKVTWTFEGVLRSYVRAGRIIRDGKIVDIAPKEMFAPEHIHEIDIEGVGRLEAFPNGDALHYAELMGLESRSLRSLGRYVLRWPGHASLWKTLVDMDLLGDEPVVVGGMRVPRRAYLAAALEPMLRYADRERDIALVRVDVAGTIGGRKMFLRHELVDRRDLETGLFAMNRTVGFTAAAGARLILGGAITGRGLLSPAADVPLEAFSREMNRHGISIGTERRELPC